MLIEFSVKNFRSIWENQTLSMMAGPTKDLLEENTFVSSASGSPRLLRSSVMYGPNGAGKSNLIAALSFMQGYVLKGRKVEERTKRTPFRFNSSGVTTPTEFEVFFIASGIRYQYGFSCTDERVDHEWLFAYPGNRSQRWFERSFNPETKGEEWYFGSKFAGSKKTWQENTRPNALFLSTALQLNSEQLIPIFTWFKSLVVIRHGELLDKDFTINSCLDDETKENILDFLKSADINIDGISIEERKFSKLDFPEDMPKDLQSFLKREVEGKNIKNAVLHHINIDSGEKIPLPLEEESDGTQKLFAYAAPWLDVLKNGRVLVVDELDNSFHPHLVRFLLKLIHSPQRNTANGQLLFTTHDTSILDQKLLRRDQVWFVEKDSECFSHIYSLSDFRPRSTEALEKGYLQGRYGALPYIGEIEF